jgi:peptidyl-prolyl cis-trans isomerase D
MMRQLRANTKWIMLITALAFVGLMVFEWGMDYSGRTAGAAGGIIARVNGENVTYEEYRVVYDNLYQQQQQMMAGSVPTAMIRQLEDAAFEQVIMQRLIEQELRRRGIGVSASEIRQAARFAPPPQFLEDELFMTDGEFDLNRYHQFLASPAVSPQLLLQLEGYYREIIPRTKLYYQTTAGIFVPDAELWRMYRDAYETATIRFVSVDPEAVVADAEVTVTEEEIRRYYREHRDRLQREARASVRFIGMSRLPTRADTAAARERVERLRGEIAEGATFEAIADREALESGELTVGPGMGLPPEFEEAALTLPVNRLSEPVLTQFGYHLIRVESRVGDQATVRYLAVPIELTRESEDRILARADSLERIGARE